jgi:hypothetical protein
MTNVFFFFFVKKKKLKLTRLPQTCSRIVTNSYQNQFGNTVCTRYKMIYDFYFYFYKELIAFIA